MSRNRNHNWEKYFVEQEIFLKKQKKKRRIIGGVIGGAVVLCLCLLIPFALKRQMEYENSEYAQVLKDIETYDYDTVEQNMADFLNEKYGTGTVTTDQLNGGTWHPDGTDSELGYQCFSAEQNDNVEKVVYAIYLSADHAVYFDNYQWPEIKKALEEDAVERSGLDGAFARPLIQQEGTYESIYQKNPWLICPAYQVYFDGDLQSLFDREYALRKELADTSQIEKQLRLCGTTALFFTDKEHADMRARMKNPELEYQKIYEKTLRDMEDAYHLDIFSCVLPDTYYQRLKTEYIAGSEGVFPRSLTYRDDGKGSEFFYSGYTLLSFAYDQLYRPIAEEETEGIYLVSDDGTKKAETYTYRKVETPPDARQLAETEYSDWKIAESFCITTETLDESGVALILDMEGRYPDSKVKLITESRDNPVTAARMGADEDMWLFYLEEVFQRDGYLFVPPIYGWDSNWGYTFTVLIR